jgi:hypothetical protein
MIHQDMERRLNTQKTIQAKKTTHDLIEDDLLRTRDPKARKAGGSIKSTSHAGRDQTTSPIRSER